MASTLLSSPLLANKAAAAADDSFKIKHSVRFNRLKQQSLTRTPVYVGNRRIWTFAAWIKKTSSNANLRFFGSTGGDNDTLVDCRFENEQIRIAAAGYVWLQTERVFRDPTSWFHVCINFNTNHPIANDRIQLWINGKQVTTFAARTNPALNALTGVNHTVKHNIGTGYLSDNVSNFDGYMADCHVLDGRAIGPAAFGEFDSAGTWNPKAFALPTPNDGSTWSDAVTSQSGSYYSGNPKTALFNGKLCLGNAGEGTDDSQAGGWVKFTPSGGMEFKQGIRVQHYVGSNSPYLIVDYTVKLTDGREFKVRKQPSVSEWQVLYEGSGEIEYIISEPPTGYNNWGAIEVDGVMLQDGKTDITTSINDGTIWSAAASGTSTVSWTKAFDGDYMDGQYPGSSNTTEWNPSTPIAFTDLRIWCYKDSTPGTLYLKGNENNWVDVTSSVPAHGGIGPQLTDFSHVAGVSTPLKGIKSVGGSGTANVVIGGILIDDQQLIDGVRDVHGKNGAYIDLGDGTSIDTIGLDVSTGKVTGSTGAKPFYVTSDAYGRTKGSGYNSEASTTIRDALKLAIPGDVITDEHNHVNTGGSAKNVINNGSTTAATEESKFYGSAISFNGKDKYLEVKAANGDKYADFAFGSDDFTVEAWVYARNWDTSWNAIFNNFRDDDSTTGWSMLISNAGKMHINIMGDWNNGATTIPTGQWVHLAMCRDASANKCYRYINGVQDATINESTQSITNTTIGLQIGGSSEYSDRYFDGYMQDIRIYKGVTKYTANFVPPVRNSFNAINLAAAGGSKFYSEELTTTTGWHSWGGTYFGPDSLFDGSTDTCSSPGDGSGAEGTWTPAGTMAYSKSVEVWGGGDSGHDQAQLNSDGWVTAPNEWLTLASGSGTITTIKWRDNRTTAAACLKGIRIDGVLLVDPQEGDVTTDSPTSYGTDTGQGGEVRSNYCTWNHYINTNNTYKNGNLEFISAASSQTPAIGTMGVTSGKWYYELIYVDGQDGLGFGVTKNPNDAYFTGNTEDSWAYLSYSGKKAHAGTQVALGDSFTPSNGSGHGTYVGVALDVDNRKIWFSINGVWQGSGANPATGANAAYTDLDENVTYFIAASPDSAGTNHTEFVLNTGQTAFKHDAPSGFKCWCTANLDDPAIADPRTVFDSQLYAGTGADQAISSFKFSPEFVWVKRTDGANGQNLFDAVRGATKYLSSSSSNAEGTDADELKSFDSDGFTYGGNAGGNAGGGNYVAWGWDASTATSGTWGANSKAYSRRTNATAGFSIIKWVGDASTGIPGTGAIPHGLSGAPDLMIQKRLDGTGHWWTGFNFIDGSWDYMKLNDTAAKGDESDALWDADEISNWGAPDGQDFIAYVFKNIEGFSQVGSFEGLGSTSKPYIHTGFRPGYIMFKAADQAYDWHVIDNARNPYNGGSSLRLKPNSNAAQVTGSHNVVDFLANGFLMRNDDNNWNHTSNTIFYMAFAEAPFKTARAR